MWRGGGSGEAALLASCYRNSLRLALENDLRTLAFPAISCGVYGYPLRAAAKIAVSECSAFTACHSGIERIIFALFDAEALRIYQAELDLP